MVFYVLFDDLNFTLWFDTFANIRLIEKVTKIFCISVFYDGGCVASCLTFRPLLTLGPYIYIIMCIYLCDIYIYIYIYVYNIWHTGSFLYVIILE